MVNPGEIYFVAGVKLGKVEYGRPCLVLRASDRDATVCFFSTKFELLRAEGVTLFASDPEFAKTGLKESCFIVPKDPKEPNTQALAYLHIQSDNPTGPKGKALSLLPNQAGDPKGPNRKALSDLRNYAAT